MRFLMFLSIFFMLTNYFNANGLSLHDILDGLDNPEREVMLYSRSSNQCKTSLDCGPFGFCDAYKYRYICYNKKPNGKLCNKSYQCLSNNCSWFRCRPAK